MKRGARPLFLCRLAQDCLLGLDGAPADKGVIAEIDQASRRALAFDWSGSKLHLWLMNDVGDPAALVGADRGFTALAQFFAARNFSPEEQASFLKSLFGTFLPMLGRQRLTTLEPLLRDLLIGGNLPRGSGRLVSVAGQATAVLVVSERMPIEDGDLLVLGTEAGLDVASVAETVRPIDPGLAGVKLVALMLQGQPRTGVGLALTGAGLAAMAITVDHHADPAAFHAATFRDEPDLFSLFYRHSNEARSALDVLSRGETGESGLRLRGSDIHFWIETAVSLENGTFIKGWFRDPDHRIETVRVIHHTLVETDLSACWITHPGRVEFRNSLATATHFTAFLPRKTDGLTPLTAAVDLMLVNGERHRFRLPQSREDRLGQRQAILNALSQSTFDDALRDRCYRPALSDLQSRINSLQSIAATKRFGREGNRKVSIIIPLYGTTAFMRAQLMAFAIDPMVAADCEIVYVVDDPLIQSEVDYILGGLDYLHALDILMVTLARNGGYALANNFGVEAASGDRLVLMNSDVVPEAPGWLEPALSRLDQLPYASVIGARLLYADHSLQHAGMFFFKLAQGYWQNMHYWKGYGRDFPEALTEREVPAVTGALMILDRAAYRDVGGFTADYVVGDYEDSDLCLKLRERGGVCIYLPSVTLFHFERQSMASNQAQSDNGSTVFNRALHSARWSERIVELMRQFGEVIDVA
ncbi:glycosyltransferase family 2 protein [Rhizobium alvei]|uniref:Glycosyltransferase n=1 Tax=Rhizobium alvei TaxID=1132659 RepID=A0ABT8YMM7_9HYPH|nr:glycosyltransferase [Rhizobium alvei]MDO6964985.1 glycosyltransferase [Rhizobium alvei]